MIKYDIKHKLSSPYYARSNGMAERNGAVIKENDNQMQGKK